MPNFQDPFEAYKKSFISAFSICMTVPLNDRLIGFYLSLLRIFFLQKLIFDSTGTNLLPMTSFYFSQISYLKYDFYYPSLLIITFIPITLKSVFPKLNCILHIGLKSKHCVRISFSEIQFLVPPFTLTVTYLFLLLFFCFFAKTFFYLGLQFLIVLEQICHVLQYHPASFNFNMGT